MILNSVNKESLQVERTARVYSLGNRTSAELESIWIVLHGYGEMASNFLQNFTALDEHKHLVIAPEGLSQYYLRGGKGDVGSSWMTKYEREAEIADQITYLDKVYSLYDVSSFQGSVNLLGFSQGVATMTRWMCMSNNVQRLDKVIFWSGSIPDNRKEGFSWSEIDASFYVVYDPTDKFLQSDNFKNGMEQFQNDIKKPSIIHITDGHYIKSETFKQLGESHNWF